MSMRLEIALPVEAPPERVFAAATDVDGFGAWMPNVVRVEKLTEGPVGVGTAFRETRKMFGKDASEHFEVTRYEPPSRFDLYVDGTKGSSRKGAYHFTHTFEPVDDGAHTMLRVQGRIEGMGCAGAVFGFLFKGMFVRMLRKDLEALKAHVEGRER